MGSPGVVNSRPACMPVLFRHRPAFRVRNLRFFAPIPLAHIVQRAIRQVIVLADRQDGKRRCTNDALKNMIETH